MNWLPLKGIKVVDFSALIPGPLATAILADLGADVIKVEPPGGDSGRSLLPAVFHANEWHDLLEPQDVPVELPMTPAEACRTEYARAREDVTEVDGERHVLFPLWADGRRAGGIRRGTPGLNADGRAVLQELGFAHGDIERILRSASARGAAGAKG